jgi:DNA repair protein RadC
MAHVTDTPDQNLTDLPRERLSRLGARSLADSELLALVLGHGTSRRPARAIASALLRDVGGVHGLARVSRERLAMATGVGLAQASRVIAAIELGRRTLCTPPRARLPLHTPEMAAALLLPMFGAHPVERVGVVLLDGRHRFIRLHLVSEGTLDAAPALPRDVFREAAIAGAAGVLLFHNHPSGDVEPSKDDVALTRRLAAAGRIVGIDLVDHVILADDKYFSFRQAGLF